MVSHTGVQPVPTKVEAIPQWPTPSSARALQGFLGLLGFYKRFIKGYASIVGPTDKPVGRRWILQVTRSSGSFCTTQGSHFPCSGSRVAGLFSTLRCWDWCLRGGHGCHPFPTEPPYSFLQQSFLPKASSCLCVRSWACRHYCRY